MWLFPNHSLRTKVKFTPTQLPLSKPDFKKRTSKNRVQFETLEKSLTFYGYQESSSVTYLDARISSSSLSLLKWSGFVSRVRASPWTAVWILEWCRWWPPLGRVFSTLMFTGALWKSPVSLHSWNFSRLRVEFLPVTTVGTQTFVTYAISHFVGIFTFLRLFILIVIIQDPGTLNTPLVASPLGYVLVKISIDNKNINSVFFCVLVTSFCVDLERAALLRLCMILLLPFLQSLCCPLPESCCNKGATWWRPRMWGSPQGCSAVI